MSPLAFHQTNYSQYWLHSQATIVYLRVSVIQSDTVKRVHLAVTLFHDLQTADIFASIKFCDSKMFTNIGPITNIDIHLFAAI